MFTTWPGLKLKTRCCKLTGGSWQVLTRPARCDGAGWTTGSVAKIQAKASSTHVWRVGVQYVLGG